MQVFSMLSKKLQIINSITKERNITGFYKAASSSDPDPPHDPC
jgi:hypothetical protein